MGDRFCDFVTYSLDLLDHDGFLAQRQSTRCLGRYGGTMRRSAALAGHLLHCADVSELDGTALHLDVALGLEARQQAADRFELQAKEAPNVLARQSQDEFRIRVAALAVSLCEVQQKYGQALFGAHAAEE